MLKYIIDCYLRIYPKTYRHPKNLAWYLVLITMLLSQGFLAFQPARPVLAQGVDTWNYSTVSDFSSCGNVVLTGTSVTNTSGGEIRLAALLEDYFDGPVINSSRWVEGLGNAGYSIPPLIKNGMVMVNSSWISSTVAVTTTDLPLAIEGRVRFRDPNLAPGIEGFIEVGLGDANDPSVTQTNDANTLFTTLEGNAVYANDFQPGFYPNTSGRQRTLISGFDWTQFHNIRILVAANQVDYYVDGIAKASHILSTPLTGVPLHLWFDSPILGYELVADWLRLARYPVTGQYISCSIDAGSTITWGNVAWQADTPLGTAVSFETRSSNDGTNWSAWSALGANNVIVSPAARYLQYRATLTTSNQTLSPEIRQVVVTSASAGTNPPTITNLQAVTPSPTTAQIIWQANQFVNSQVSYGLTTGLGTIVTDSEFNPNHTLDLTGLQPGMLYYYQISGTNASGQSVQSPILNFTTPTNLLTQTSANDFGLGGSCNVLTQTIVSDASGGEIRLRSTKLEDYFNGTSLDTTQWDGREVDQPGKTYTPTVSGGMVTLLNPVDGARIQSKVKYSRPLAIEFRAQLGTDANQTLGFSNFNNKWIFSGTSMGGYIYAWSSNNEVYPGTLISLQGVAPNTFNDYRIVWETNRIEFWVNGVLRSTHTKNFTGDMFVQATNFPTNTTPVYVDWYRVLSSPPDGQFRSCMFDAGQQVDWDALSRVAQIPAGTALSLRTRSSTDGVNWSEWSSSLIGQNNNISSPSGRYLQYEANLTSNNSRLTPLLESVTVSYDTIVLTPPMAEAGGPYNGNVGIPIALDGSSSSGNGPFTFAWDLDADNQFDDAFSSSANYTWNTAGVYIVTLLITDTNNLTDTDIATATVNPALPPTANAGGPYNGAEGTVIGLNGSGSNPSGGSVSYAWDLDEDGQYDDASTAATSFTQAEPGVYTVTLQVTNAQSLTDTDTTQVTVTNLAPTASTNGPYGGLRNALISLESFSSDPGGGVLSHAWDLDDDGQFDDAFTVSTTYSWSQTGVYTASLLVTDTQGLTDSTTTQVTVAENVPAPDAGGPYSGAEGTSINLIGSSTAPNGGPLNYAWDLDQDGQFDDAFSASTIFSASEPGIYTVTLKVTDNGVPAIDSAQVTVTNLAPSAEAGGPYNGTAELSINLSGSGTDPGGGSLNYAWDLDSDGQFDDAMSATTTFTWSVSGTYTVALRVSDAQGLTSTDTAQVVVDPKTQNGSSYNIFLPIILR